MSRSDQKGSEHRQYRTESAHYFSKLANEGASLALARGSLGVNNVITSINAMFPYRYETQHVTPQVTKQQVGSVVVGTRYEDSVSKVEYLGSQGVSGSVEWQQSVEPATGEGDVAIAADGLVQEAVTPVTGGIDHVVAEAEALTEEAAERIRAAQAAVEAARTPLTPEDGQGAVNV